jgi:hypothetical protein
MEGRIINYWGRRREEGNMLYLDLGAAAEEAFFNEME